MNCFGRKGRSSKMTSPNAKHPAAAQKLLEFIAFGLAQLDRVTYIHLRLLVGGASESIDESRIRQGEIARHAALHRKARPVPGLHLRIFAHLPTGPRGSRFPAPLPCHPAFRPSNDTHPRSRRLDQPQTRHPTKHRASRSTRAFPNPKVAQYQPVKFTVTRC